MARINLAQSARQAPSASAVITVGNLTKRFSAPGGGDKFTVIDAVSLTVAEGEFVSIVGPSGCGKSTLLNIIAGIEPYDGGSVTISPPAGKAGVEPHIGYVFQSPRLLNWLTVEQNIEFVLEVAILERAKPTILFVTHDLSEAVFLSDHIYMMSTKPARIFRHVPVGIPRPRQPEDAMIFDLEKALVREFFSVVAETG